MSWRIQPDVRQGTKQRAGIAITKKHTMKTKRITQTPASMAESTPPKEARTPQSSTPQTSVPNSAEPKTQEAAGPTTPTPTVTSESSKTAPQTDATPATSNTSLRGDPNSAYFTAHVCLYRKTFLADFPATDVIPTTPSHPRRRRDSDGPYRLSIQMVIFFRMKKADADKLSDARLKRMLERSLAQSAPVWKVYEVTR